VQNAFSVECKRCWTEVIHLECGLYLRVLDLSNKLSSCFSNLNSMRYGSVQEPIWTNCEVVDLLVRANHAQQIEACLRHSGLGGCYR
jgi:hypothetical protein